MKRWIWVLDIILFIIVLQLVFVKFFREIEFKTYDLRAKMAVDNGLFAKKFQGADKNIVIVTVDDYSRNEISKNPQLRLGSWPWRRDIWADVINLIEADKPKAIVFDLIFTDVSSDMPYDSKLSDTIKTYDNIILATSLNNPQTLVDKYGTQKVRNSNYTPASTSLDVQINNKKLEKKLTYYSHSAVHDMYSTNATMGVVNKITEDDSVIRASQPVFKLIKGDKTYYMPSLALATMLKITGDKPIAINGGKLFIGNRALPITSKGTVQISWHGLGRNYKRISVSDLLLGKVPLNEFNDKIVLIGRTEAGTDIHPSAVNSNYAGVEFNATVIDNLINDTNPANTKARKFLTHTPVWVDALVTFGLCALIVLIVAVSKNALLGIFNGILILIIYMLVAIFLFAEPNLRVWIPLAVPIYYMSMTLLGGFAVRLQGEHAKKAQIMNVFGKFVSPSVLNTVLKEQGALQLKNSRKHVTVMFCDVKNFTTLSENTEAEKLVKKLNEIFEIIVNIIFANGGTVDKFVGDCVMAYWGDPVASRDDAYLAVKTALEIKKAISDLEKNSELPLDVKIGISTGDALLGLVGAHKIMSYTAMGDTVNVASRLEASCNKYGRDILMSKETALEAGDRIISEEIGSIEVKGREKSVEIHEPKGFSDNV